MTAAESAPLADDVRLRFLLVGSWNTLFGYLCFALVHLALGARLGPTATIVGAYLIALPMAFLTQKYLVFRCLGDAWAQLARFGITNSAIFVANMVSVPAVLAVTTWPALWVQAGFVGISTMASYLAHARFSFRRRA